MKTRTHARSNGRTTTRATAIAAAALLTAGVLLTASPAAAAPAAAPPAVDPSAPDPGDAATIGAAGEVAVDIGPFQFSGADAAALLQLTEPGQDSASLVDVALVDLDQAHISLGFVDTAVKSDAVASGATAVVGDATADLFGMELLMVEVASSAVSCPLYGTSEAVAEVDGLTLLGAPAVIDAQNPVAEASATLPADVPAPDGIGTVDLSSLTVTVLVTQATAVDDTGAASVSLLAQVLIDGTLGTQVFTRTVVSDLVLGETICAKPATPLSVSAITPATGSTAGGESVTITGSGFVAGTTVAFGSTPATGVAADALGISLIAVSPANAAGATTVTVTNPDGSTATLAYTYVAPAPAPVPVPAGNGGSGAATLAETGSDAGPLALGAVGIAGLGALFAAFALVRRRAA